ncbi:Hypothetical predicted protein [Pelobates cultripes]|uniref:Uncharacterized protein n=1 Tax=Pelobates cultripes TaxID=61616 RepID=A0AAD1S2X1_PELCU|nr:Hypothetical predicted protein [Pelobates cultripes]
MHDFVATPVDLKDAPPKDKMAASSLGTERMADSQVEGEPSGVLAKFRAELTQILARMFSKTDRGALVQELQTALREELAGLHADLTTLEQKVARWRPQHSAIETLVNWQGNMLINFRRQIEDLENRSRHNNIRIRGLLEMDAAPLTATLEALFKQILGADPPEGIRFNRAHRALGPARQDGSLQDVVCCCMLTA